MPVTAITETEPMSAVAAGGGIGRSHVAVHMRDRPEAADERQISGYSTIVYGTAKKPDTVPVTNLAGTAMKHFRRLSRQWVRPCRCATWESWPLAAE
jgi:hypothetical protein